MLVERSLIPEIFWLLFAQEVNKLEKPEKLWLVLHVGLLELSQKYHMFFSESLQKLTTFCYYLRRDPVN